MGARPEVALLKNKPLLMPRAPWIVMLTVRCTFNLSRENIGRNPAAKTPEISIGWEFGLKMMG